MSGKRYFLIYRYTDGQQLDPDKPDTGMVIKPGTCYRQEADARVHQAPYEELLIVEVYNDREKQLAERLNAEWWQTLRDFCAIVNPGGPTA